MKSFTFLLLTFFCVNLSIAQSLNIKLFEQIAGISFVSIDEVMVNGYGFTKMKEENGGKKITYVKGKPNDLSQAIIVKILNSKTALNTLDIMVGKYHDMRGFKDDLVSNGYLYKGTNDYNFAIYNKGKISILIANELSGKFYQILFVSEPY